jgi:phage terminase small subunit
MAWYDGLTERQRRFCEAYSANGGNALGAAREAGYKRPHPQGALNIQNDTVKKALDLLRQEATSAAIATREERQSFWTTVLRDAEEDMRNRLKASELLGKSQVDFIERVDATTRIIVEHVQETIGHG